MPTRRLPLRLAATGIVLAGLVTPASGSDDYQASCLSTTLTSQEQTVDTKETPFLASHTTAGQAGNNDSTVGQVTDDGAYAFFYSRATDLVEGAPKEGYYRQEVASGHVELVNITADGNLGLRANRTRTSVSGKSVAFQSYRPDAGYGTTIRDLHAGTERFVASYPGLKSAYPVAFSSNEAWLVTLHHAGNNVYKMTVIDLSTGEQQLLEPALEGGLYGAAISDDGARIAFDTRSTLTADDEGSTWDVYLLDRAAGQTRLISDAPGVDSQISTLPTMSAAGDRIVFRSREDLANVRPDEGRDDVFLYDVDAGHLRHLDVGRDADAWHFDPHISGNGDYIVYTSTADDLVIGDINEGGDLFRYNIDTGCFRLISWDENGRQYPGGDNNARGYVSTDGAHVAYWTYKPLTAADGNTYGDVYVYHNVHN